VEHEARLGRLAQAVPTTFRSAGVALHCGLSCWI
jgi:hypothetical protein